MAAFGGNCRSLEEVGVEPQVTSTGGCALEEARRQLDGGPSEETLKLFVGREG